MVCKHLSGDKQVHHPVIRDLHLVFESMELTSHQGLLLIAYTAAPGSKAANSHRLPTTRTVTTEQEPATKAVDATSESMVLGASATQ
jgi:hypothetical protein